MKSHNSQVSSMYRSGTMPLSLPKINKLTTTKNYNNKTSRYSNALGFAKQRNSFHTSRLKNTSFLQGKTQYTQRVKHEVLDEKQYPFTQTSSISKEHQKLKQLLKDFNEETIKILQKYISKPVKKQYVKNRKPIQSLYEIRAKQSQNSQNIIHLLKKQIQSLQSRCQNLKYMSLEQFQHRINQINEQKHKIITQNKNISRQITLNGLGLVRGKQSMVKQLEYDQYLLDLKREKLRSQTDNVRRQTDQVERKIRQLTCLEQKYELQQSYSSKMHQEIQNQKIQHRLLKQLKNRQRNYQHLKVMAGSEAYQLKHKYFQKLKQLQQYSSMNQQKSKKIDQINNKLVQAKKLIQSLQTKQMVFGVRNKTSDLKILTLNSKKYKDQVNKVEVNTFQQIQQVKLDNKK